MLLRNPIVFNKKRKDEVAIQSGPTLIEIKHGGTKKIEHTYTSKDGTQKKCAVYSEFKHKIPTKMRHFIDKHSDVLEVIRIDQYKKPMSQKHLGKNELDFEKYDRFASNNNIVSKKDSEEFKQTTFESSKKKISEFTRSGIHEGNYHNSRFNVSNNRLAVPSNARLPSISDQSIVDCPNGESHQPEISNSENSDSVNNSNSSEGEEDISAAVREMCSNSPVEEEKHEKLGPRIENNIKPQNGGNNFGHPELNKNVSDAWNYGIEDSEEQEEVEHATLPADYRREVANNAQ